MSWDLRTEETRTTTRAQQPLIEETYSRTGRTLSIVGFVCAVISLMVLPLLFGAAAVVCGLVGWWSGDRLGMWAAIAGVVCAVAGYYAANVVVNNSKIGY
jgi:hypothetical protein